MGARERGQPIGVMGATGNVTGPHLHLSRKLLIPNGNPLNTNNGFQGGVDPTAAVAKLNTVAGRGGRTTFEWLDGEFFLIQRFTVDNPAAPSGIAIIGPGEAAETFWQHTTTRAGSPASTR